MVSLHKVLWRKWVIKVKQHKSNEKMGKKLERYRGHHAPEGPARALKAGRKGGIQGPHQQPSSLWVGINKAEIQEEGSVDEAVTLSLPQRAGGGAGGRHNEALEADK